MPTLLERLFGLVPVGTFKDARPNKDKFELLDGDYTSKNADGSRDLSWGWYPVARTPKSLDSGWTPTGRSRTVKYISRNKKGVTEYEFFAGVWFGKEIKTWLFQGDDGKWYHADPP
jgi:hypothetical protein